MKHIVSLFAVLVVGFMLSSVNAQSSPNFSVATSPAVSSYDITSSFAITPVAGAVRTAKVEIPLPAWQRTDAPVDPNDPAMASKRFSPNAGPELLSVWARVSYYKNGKWAIGAYSKLTNTVVDWNAKIISGILVIPAAYGDTLNFRAVGRIADNTINDGGIFVDVTSKWCVLENGKPGYAANYLVPLGLMGQ